MTFEDRRTARETVSIEMACHITGVSRRTIYNWINAGKVEFVRTPGGAVRIYSDTLLKPPTHLGSTEPR